MFTVLEHGIEEEYEEISKFYSLKCFACYSIPFPGYHTIYIRRILIVKI